MAATRKQTHGGRIEDPAARADGSRRRTKRDSVGFRPTPDERRILDELNDEGVTSSDALRRGLRLLVQERWLEQARSEMLANRDENLNDEPDAW